jgi:hypothetical protein
MTNVTDQHLKLKMLMASQGMHPDSIEELVAVAKDGGTISVNCALELLLILEQIADRLMP